MSRLRLGPPVIQSAVRKIIQSGRAVVAGTRQRLGSVRNQSSVPACGLPTVSSTKAANSTNSSATMAFSGHANLIGTLLGSGAVILTAPQAHAQIVYYPYVGATVTQSGGTITSGGTFQTVLASNPNRHGCLIQNTSSHVMSVYVGTRASATAANSIQIEPISTTADGLFRCNHGPFILTGDVNITMSATSDPYVVMSW